MELRLIDDAFVKICDMVNDCSVSVRTEAARFLVRNNLQTRIPACFESQSC